MNNPHIKTYQSDREYLQLSFEYPAAWRIIEDRGKIQAYSQALVIGPNNTAETFSANFVVLGSPIKAKGGRFENIAQLRGNFTSHLYENPHFLDSLGAKIEKYDAETVIATYTIPPTFDKGIKPLEVPVKTKAFFTQVNDCFYEVIYTADVQDFSKYENDFDHLVKSIRFKKSI